MRSDSNPNAGNHRHPIDGSGIKFDYNLPTSLRDIRNSSVTMSMLVK